MTEGGFPKVAGDVVYASEMNEMYSGFRLYGTSGTHFTYTGSRTSLTDIGSFVIGPGSVTNNSSFKILCFTETVTGSLAIQMSGTSFGQNLVSTLQTNNRAVITSDGYLNNIVSYIGTLAQTQANTTNTNIGYVGASYPGSGFVLNFQFMHSNNSVSGGIPYMIAKFDNQYV